MLGLRYGVGYAEYVHDALVVGGVVVGGRLVRFVRVGQLVAPGVGAVCVLIFFGLWWRLGLLFAMLCCGLLGGGVSIGRVWRGLLGLCTIGWCVGSRLLICCRFAVYVVGAILPGCSLLGRGVVRVVRGFRGMVVLAWFGVEHGAVGRAGSGL